MDIKRVIRRSLRLSGYNIDGANFEKTSVYKSASDMIVELELDMQRDIGLNNASKVAKLSQVNVNGNTYFQDFIKSNSGAKVYELPGNFVEYIGSTRSDFDTFVVGGYVISTPKNNFKIIDTSDDEEFWFRYKARMRLEEFPEIIETYCANYLALELINTLRPDDQNRIRNIQNKLNQEKRSFFESNMIKTRVNVKTGVGFGWR